MTSREAYTYNLSFYRIIYLEVIIAIEYNFDLFVEKHQTSERVAALLLAWLTPRG
jgi:hypothetical protein